MPPESAKFLRDMLDAARAIEQYTNGQKETDFLARRELRDAVNWNFCVIGEALSQLAKIDLTTAKSLTEYARIISFRNQLIHGYGVIDIESPGASFATNCPSSSASYRDCCLHDQCRTIES